MCIQIVLAYTPCQHEIDFYIQQCNKGFRDGFYCQPNEMEDPWIVETFHDRKCVNCNPDQGQADADRQWMKDHEANHIQAQAERERFRNSHLSQMRGENNNADYRRHMDGVREVNPGAPSVAAPMPSRSGTQSVTGAPSGSRSSSASASASRPRGGAPLNAAAPLSSIAEGSSGSRHRTVARDFGANRPSQQREPGSRAHAQFPQGNSGYHEAGNMQNRDVYGDVPQHQLMPNSEQTTYTPPPLALVAHAQARQQQQTRSQSRNTPSQNNNNNNNNTSGQETWQDHNAVDLRPVHWDENESEVERAMALSRDALAHQPMALHDDDDAAFQDVLELSRNQYEESGADAELAAQEQRQMQETMDMSKQMYQMGLLDQWSSNAAANRAARGSSSGSGSASSSSSRQAPLQRDNWTQRPAGYSGGSASGSKSSSASMSRGGGGSGPLPSRSSTANNPSPLRNSSSNSSSSTSASRAAGTPLPPSTGSTQNASISRAQNSSASGSGSGTAGRSTPATRNAPMGLKPKTASSSSSPSSTSTSNAANTPLPPSTGGTRNASLSRSVPRGGPSSSSASTSSSAARTPLPPSSGSTQNAAMPMPMPMDQGRADPNFLRNQRLANLGSQTTNAAMSVRPSAEGAGSGSGSGSGSQSSSAALDKGKGRAPP